MQKFDWSTAFEVGVKAIDDDHRRLFALAREVVRAIEIENHDLCRAKIEEFIDAAELHFATEEALLVRVDFPAAEKHKTYHRSLLAGARALKKVCGEERDPEQMEHCYVRVMAWLIDDVVAGDSTLKSHFNHYGFKDTD